MNGPILMSWAPKVSLAIDFLGVSFSVLWLLFLPLLFYLSILRLFTSLFLTPYLAFSFAFYFEFPEGEVLKFLTSLRL